jgi:hypothetical protein
LTSFRSPKTTDYEDDDEDDDDFLKGMVFSMTQRKWSVTFLLLLLTLSQAANAQTPQVSVNAPDDVTPGSTVEVRVDLSNLSNLGGVVFDVRYDGARLSLQNVSVEGTLATQGVFASNPETFPSQSGRVRFGFVSADAVSGNGTAVKLIFRLLPGTTGANPLPLENLKGVDGNLSEVTLNTADGVLRVLLQVIDVKTGLQFLTIPVWLTRPSPTDVFEVPESELANKLAVFDPMLNQGLGGYRIFGRDAGDYGFLLGQAIWMKNDAQRRVRIREGELPDPSQSVAIPLRVGWNAIGSPRSTSLLWSLTALQVRKDGQTMTLAEARAAGWIEDFLWGFRQDANDSNKGSYFLVYDSSIISGVAGTMEPGQGYWMKANAACDLIVPPPSTAAASRARTQRKPSRNDWLVTLSAEANGAKDSVLFGASSARSSDFSRLQIAKPPLAPGQGDAQVFLVRSADILSAEGQAGSLRYEHLGVDVRRSLADKEEWHLIVRSAQPNADVTLRWNDLGKAPRPLRFRLIDETTGARRYMRTTDGYTFRTGAAGEERAFRIELDATLAAGKLLNHLSVLNNKAGGSAHFSFVLSQPATITARVITPTGKVASVIARGVEGKQGLNALTWNGKSASGAAMPRGIYIIELTAVTGEGQEMRDVRTFALR